MDKEIKREIMLDNYQNPFNKETVNDKRYIKVNTNTESCIDNIDMYILIEDNKLKDIKFDGEACAISTSATSIMIRTLLNKNIDEVIMILNNYYNMINEEEYNKDVLKELNVYDEIYLQPNRKGCALLPFKAMINAIEKYKE